MSPEARDLSGSPKDKDTIYYLTLGWQVTPAGEPRYWLRADAKPGDQQDSELFRVPASTMGTHTVIIAQSGSGKSFFLGRLIEELVRWTLARCLIIDPNADFRKIQEVQGESLWKNENEKGEKKKYYDPENRSGKLPHEASRDVFEPHWSMIPKRIRLGDSRQRGMSPPYEPLRVWWSRINVDFLTEELNPLQQNELYQCHSFFQHIEHLYSFPDRGPVDLLQIAKEVYDRGLKYGDFPDALKRKLQDFGIDPQGDGRLSDAINLAARAIESVHEEMAHFYFSQALKYKNLGLVELMSPPCPPERTPIDVIDLPSLPDKNARILAVNAILADEWNHVRNAWAEALERPALEDNRVPTFVVLDEAHNFIPAEPQGRQEAAIREQFRTIAAEGRKYGLFLILVSQRPDKLDPFVLSECQNKALMQLDSEAVLKIVGQKLGLEDIPPRLLGKCLEFGRGRVLIAGSWAARGPEVFYCAARRTQEGGRDLQARYWAKPR